MISRSNGNFVALIHREDLSLDNVCPIRNLQALLLRKKKIKLAKITKDMFIFRCLVKFYTNSTAFILPIIKKILKYN